MEGHDAHMGVRGAMADQPDLVAPSPAFLTQQQPRPEAQGSVSPSPSPVPSVPSPPANETPPYSASASGTGQRSRSNSRTKPHQMTQSQVHNKRQRATPDQLAVLEQTFAVNPHPDNKARIQLSNQIQMTERSVQIWFQNRRAKLKSMSRKSTDPSLGDLAMTPASGTPSHYQPRPPMRSSSMSDAPHLTNRAPAERWLGGGVGGFAEPQAQPPPQQQQHQQLSQQQQLQHHLLAGFEGVGPGASGAGPGLNTAPVNFGESTPLSCRSLSIGSWRRICFSPTDLLCSFSLGERMFRYFIREGNKGFLIQYPFDVVVCIDICPIATVQLAPGGQMQGSTASNTDIAELNPTVRVVIKLSIPPQFSLDEDGSGRWQRCPDFTEDSQASKILTHSILGSSTLLKSQLKHLSDAVPELGAVTNFKDALGSLNTVKSDHIVRSNQVPLSSYRGPGEPYGYSLPSSAAPSAASSPVLGAIPRAANSQMPYFNLDMGNSDEVLNEKQMPSLDHSTHSVQQPQQVQPNQGEYAPLSTGYPNMYKPAQHYRHRSQSTPLLPQNFVQPEAGQQRKPDSPHLNLQQPQNNSRQHFMAQLMAQQGGYMDFDVLNGNSMGGTSSDPGVPQTGVGNMQPMLQQYGTESGPISMETSVASTPWLMGQNVETATSVPHSTLTSGRNSPAFGKNGNMAGIGMDVSASGFGQVPSPPTAAGLQQAMLDHGLIDSSGAQSMSPSSATNIFQSGSTSTPRTDALQQQAAAVHSMRSQPAAQPSPLYQTLHADMVDDSMVDASRQAAAPGLDGAYSHVPNQAPQQPDTSHGSMAPGFVNYFSSIAVNSPHHDSNMDST